MGKSTLLNRLTEANVLVEDKLFSTLDPATRRLRLPGGETILLSDTVGFVRAACRTSWWSRSAPRSRCRATPISSLHVVDALPPEAEAQIKAVYDVLREIDADEVPEMLVVTKVDASRPDDVDDLTPRLPRRGLRVGGGGNGIDKLLDRIADRPGIAHPLVELHVPYDRGDVPAALHRDGDVLVEVHGRRGTPVRARCRIDWAGSRIRRERRRPRTPPLLSPR